MKKWRPSTTYRPTLELLETLALPGSTVFALLGTNLFYPTSSL